MEQGGSAASATVSLEIPPSPKLLFALGKTFLWLRPFLELEDLKTVAQAMVTSRLDFCNALYIGLPLCLVRKLQLVQNIAARLVTFWAKYKAVSYTHLTLPTTDVV